ncbi:MAG: hypothetical protein ACTHJ2_01000 [Candidatus Nitrosocosmicus sp.]
MKRGTIIMIIGAVLFFLGIAISVLWAGSFFKTILNQSILLTSISIPASSSNNNTLQVNDLTHPIILQLHMEKDNNLANNNSAFNNIRETVKDPTGKILSQSNISKEFTASIKPTVEGLYTLSLYNSGNLPVKIGGVFAPIQFLNQNNQVNINFFSGAIIGVILIIIGILTFIVGLIIAILERRK